jgi:S1-C subfamily serine protease
MFHFRSVSRKASASLMALLFVMGFLVGGIAIFYVNYRQINSLSKSVLDLQNQISMLTGSQNISLTNQTITIYQNNIALADLYAKVSNSVVLVQGITSDGDVQGSGFVYEYLGRMVTITNYHVVSGTTSLSVTFSNGHSYSARILGSDVYADLAVLSVNASANEYNPIRIVSSSSLRVGDQVIAIGNPYGLVGSLTTGVVSALGRSIQEDYTASFSIANIIQTSTPINPGNSGGPLLNAVGDVIGITTAIVSDSQGLGFAIPSDTMLREIPSLISTGAYTAHSYLGVYGNDMNFALAEQLNVDITYGWLINSTSRGGPADGKLKGGDILIALNGTTIRNNDDLASYLEGKTLPGDLIVLTIVRDNLQTSVNITLGTRPMPTT